MDAGPTNDVTKPLGVTETEWLIPRATGEQPEPEELRQGNPDSSRRPLGVAAALVAGGALVGAVAVSMLHNATSPSASANAVPAAASNGNGNGPAVGRLPGQQGQLPGQQGQLPGSAPGDRDGDGGGFGGRGGLDGEQRLSGTLTAVGSSAVTVRTSSGTATYTVTSTTQIVRDGAAATLSQLQIGDPVFVHVYPAPSGGALLVERLFAGTTTGFGGPPPAGTSTT